jgi:hypothetical protein
MLVFAVVQCDRGAIVRGYKAVGHSRTVVVPSRYHYRGDEDEDASTRLIPGYPLRPRHHSLDKTHRTIAQDCDVEVRVVVCT